mgnify:CR=1 FL=1
MEWLIVGIAAGFVVGFMVGRLSADKPPVYRYDGKMRMESAQKVWVIGDESTHGVYQFPPAEMKEFEGLDKYINPLVNEDSNDS